MRIGLTYDLKREYLADGYGEEEVAELDRDDTIDALERAVARAGHTPVRIGRLSALVAKLAAGERWDLVLNIAEGVHGLARESAVPALLDAYRIPYTFSDALVLAVSLHKGLAKHVVAAAGVPTPRFLVVESVAELDRVDLPFPLFVKPAAEGSSRGVTPRSLVHDRAALAASTAWLLATYAQPVLVETFLPGREFTVGVLGSGAGAEVLGTLEVKLGETAEQGIYSYDNKQDFEGRVFYELADPRVDDQARAAEAVALAAWRALGGRDLARVDVRLDAAGEPQFIEANPLPGLNPDISDLAILIRKTGLPYDALIAKVIDNAAARAGLG